MGTFINDWRQMLSGSELRLSHLLSMYYSEDGVFDTQNRACQRKDLYSAVAPNDRLLEQVRHCSVWLLKGEICIKNV
jgi:hypothetical protein